MESEDTYAEGRTLDEWLGAGEAYRRRFAGTLAKPCREEYGTILALHLIAGAGVYGIVVGVAMVVFLGGRLLVASLGEPVWEVAYRLVTVGLGGLAGGFFFGAVLAGGVGLLSLTAMILFRGGVGIIPVGLGGRRDGMVLGNVVGGLLASPVWVAVWSFQSVSWEAMSWLCFWTIPLILTLQAAGALAAPGDLLTRRPSEWRFGLRELLVATTVIAVLAAMIGSGLPALVGVSWLLHVAIVAHLITRGPTSWCLRWLLRRRFARRRRERVSVGSDPVADARG